MSRVIENVTDARCCSAINRGNAKLHRWAVLLFIFAALLEGREEHRGSRGGQIVAQDIWIHIAVLCFFYLECPCSIVCR